MGFLGLFFKTDSTEIKKSAFFERRKNNRFPPGKNYNLKVLLQDEQQAYELAVINVSVSGIRLFSQFPINSIETADSNLIISLLDKSCPSIGRWIYTKKNHDGYEYSFSLKFNQFKDRQLYWEMFYPIWIGGSLKALPSKVIHQNEPELIKKVYYGNHQSFLSIWYGKETQEPTQFQFEIQNYIIRGKLREGLDFFINSTNKSNYPVATLLNQTESNQDQLSQLNELYELILLNLSNEVGSDDVTFLEQFSTKRKNKKTAA